MANIIVISGGRTWESRPSRFIRYNGTPTMVIDLLGSVDDIKQWKNPENTVLMSSPIGGGWCRHWLQTSDPEMERCWGVIADNSNG